MKEKIKEILTENKVKLGLLDWQIDDIVKILSLVPSVTDDEIDKQIEYHLGTSIHLDDARGYKYGFRDCAKWMRDNHLPSKGEPQDPIVEFISEGIKDGAKQIEPPQTEKKSSYPETVDQLRGNRVVTSAPSKGDELSDEDIRKRIYSMRCPHCDNHLGTATGLDAFIREPQKPDELVEWISVKDRLPEYNETV